MHTLMHDQSSLFSLFTMLDSSWYITIAVYGYNAPAYAKFAHAYTAFFPFFPMLIRAGVYLDGLAPMLQGQLLSNSFFFTALCLFHYFLEKNFDVKTARLGCFLLALSPYNIYFMAVYTESLFLCLMLGFWLAAQSKRWVWMGLIGCAMSLTHPNGVLIGFFAFWFMLDDYRKNHPSLWNYWPIVLIPLGLLSYMVFLYFEMGDPLAFVHYQIYWQRTGWHYGFLVRQMIDQLNRETYDFCIYVLGLAVSAFLWTKRLYKEAVFIPIFLSLAILSGSFMSLARFTGGTFTFYLGLTLLGRETAWRNTIIVVELLISIPLMFWWLSSAAWAF